MLTRLTNNFSDLTNPYYAVVVVDRVLGPVLAQGSTATGNLTRRVKSERLAWPGKMKMTTSTIIAKNGLYMYEYIYMRGQPEVSLVTEWDVKVWSNSVSAQCKLKNKYYQLNLATVILRGSNLVFCSDPILTWTYKVLAQSTTMQCSILDRQRLKKWNEDKHKQIPIKRQYEF